MGTARVDVLEAGSEVGSWPSELVKFLLGVDWLHLRADWLDDRPWPSSAKTAPALPLVHATRTACLVAVPSTRSLSSYRSIVDVN